MSRTPTYRDVAPRHELVSYDEAMDAKVFIDESYKERAEAIADADYLEYMVSVVESEGLKNSKETSADRRKAEARTAALYLKRLKEWRDARIRALIIDGKVKFAQQKFDMFRTMEATRRARELAEADNRVQWSNSRPPRDDDRRR
jgi:hypothetical protein